MPNGKPRRQAVVTKRSLTYADNITRGRKLVGYATQQAFADALGIAQSTVARWERGEVVPRDDMKLEIAALLHQEVRSIFPLIPNGDDADVRVLA